MAFLASKPAPSITEGFDVLVQLVMAEITTEPEEKRTDSYMVITGSQQRKYKYQSHSEHIRNPLTSDKPVVVFRLPCVSLYSSPS
jgi:hypothetical protein